MRREEFAEMTVVEFRRRRRRGAERKDMRMRGAVESNLGFAGKSPGQTRDSSNERSSNLDPEMAARAEALARRVREYREEFAFSQQEFAEESGISRATLSKVEQGHIFPSMQIRKKLAKALGVGPQELWHMQPDINTDHRDKENNKLAS
jgi:DNA-binding XRE family transcriptional regulator